MKVHIRNWHGVATWHWKAAHSENGDDELCGICRVPFDGTCPNCKFPGDDCPLVLGKGCTHNFHLHCILQWLEQESSRGLCPMCRQTFIAQTVEGVGTEKALEDLKMLVSRHQAQQEQGNVSGEYEAFSELPQATREAT